MQPTVQILAGAGVGLSGERSGLFWEIARLAGELRPEYIFLENVPAITSRGGIEVVGALTAMGYDSRWCTLSAAAVGANHRRNRWWLLAHAKSDYPWELPERTTAAESRSGGLSDHVANADGAGLQTPGPQQQTTRAEQCSTMANSGGTGCEEQHPTPQPAGPGFGAGGIDAIWRADWWAVEPPVGRVAHGVPHRVDCIRGLGNSVVPYQALTVYELLSGLRRPTA